jgi:hypothetical protein
LARDAGCFRSFSGGHDGTEIGGATQDLTPFARAPKINRLKRAGVAHW